jgi:hypothetical protein
MTAVTVEPYTSEARLCDDDGIVRRGTMWHGADYACTGSAHPRVGEHVRCTNPRHTHLAVYWGTEQTEQAVVHTGQTRCLVLGASVCAACTGGGHEPSDHA